MSLASWVQEVFKLYLLMVMRNKHTANLKSCATIFNKTSNFKVSITEIYPRIPWEMVEDPLGSAEHTMGTTGLEGSWNTNTRTNMPTHFNSKTSAQR
jgi:hypothetical protein